MTWDYERSFQYWNHRLHTFGRDAEDKLPALEGWDYGVKARAEVNRRMANDSRLHSDIRNFARKISKQAFDHLNGKCRTKKNRYTGFVYPCDICDSRDRFLKLLERYPDIK